MAKAFRREINLGDGSGVQVFEADTAEELVDKLADAQVNATKKIQQLSGEAKLLRRQVIEQPETGAPDPEGPIPDFKPRQLTADEEFDLTRRMNNPATARAAAREMLEAELGAPLETVRRTLRRAETLPRQLNGRDAAEQFLLNHPEYVPSQANSTELFGHMTKKGMALTTQNFEIAFAELGKAGLLELRQAKDPSGTAGDGNAGGDGTAAVDSAAGAGSTRPRFASTSIATRPSGSPRGVSGPKMPTAEEIERMPTPEYRRRYNDPVNGAAFRAHVDRLEAEKSARAARR